MSNQPSPEKMSQPSPLAGGTVMSKILKFGIPLLVSVGLCAALLRDIDFPEMMRIIREECNFWIIGAVMLIGIIPVAIRALRWGIQLKAINVRPPFRILFYSIFGTYSFNVVFPRLGEIWRTGYIAYRQQAPFSEILGSMLADRLADTVCVALMTLLTCIFASGTIFKFIEAYPQAYNAIIGMVSSPWFWLGMVAFLAACWALLKYGRGRILDRVRSFFKGIWEGFAAIATMNGKGRWLLLTVALWSCYFFQLYLAFYAFPMTRAMLEENGILVAVICYILSTISMGIPSNGGIGPYQTAIIFGLQLFVPAALTADPVAYKSFVTAGAAFGNTLIASMTLVWIIGGIIVFLLIAADRRRSAA